MTEEEYINELKKRWPKNHQDSEPTKDTIALTTEALEKYPNSDKLWVIRGNLLLLIDFECELPLNESEKCYRRAIKINPQSVEAYYELACYFDAVAGKARKAKQFYDKHRRLSNA